MVIRWHHVAGLERLHDLGQLELLMFYHWDWTLVSSPGVRFENLVASHLLKWVHFHQDTEGQDLDLRYFRDHDRREVDFVVVEGLAPVLMVECKLDDAPVDPGLRYLKARFPACDA